MDLEEISLAGRAEFLPSYLNYTESLSKEKSNSNQKTYPLEETSFPVSYSVQFKTQQVKTQQVAYFVIQKNSPHFCFFLLREYQKRITWIQVISSSRFKNLFKKIVESLEKTIFFEIKQERLMSYQDFCREKFREKLKEFIKSRKN